MATILSLDRSLKNKFVLLKEGMKRDVIEAAERYARTSRVAMLQCDAEPPSEMTDN
jgi:hypothetical protein